MWKMASTFCNPRYFYMKPWQNIITRNIKRFNLSKYSANVKIGKTSSIVKLSFGFVSGYGIKTFTVKTVFCEAQYDIKNRTASLALPVSKDEPEFNWSRFFEMLKPHVWELFGAVVAALVCAVMNVQIPRALGNLINLVQQSAKDQTKHFLTDIKLPAFNILSMYIVQSAFTFVYIYLLSNVGERLSNTMRSQLFSSIVKQDIAFFDRWRTGELINRLTVDVNDFKSSFKMVVSQGLRNTTQLVGSAVSLFFISPQMATVMLLVVPTVIAGGTLIGSLLRKTSYEAKAQSAKVTLVGEEALSNIRTVRAFAMEDVEQKIFDVEAEKARCLHEKLGLGIGLFQAGANLFLNGIVLGTIYMGGYLVSTDSMTGGDVMAFLVAAQILQRSFGQLSVLFGTYVKGIHAGARVFEVLERVPEIDLHDGKTIPYHSFIAEVEFKNVKFAYPERSQIDVLKDFSVKVPAGKTVAIVGSSGSGKSTLAWLLERFYDVDWGAILVGGSDIRGLNPSWLRGRVIGFISQEPVLFATTVMENIRYGRPDASDNEVMEAAKLANAHEFIKEFPDGYSTMVGERGVSVSGGQKQRIAIARALLKNPSILILDEATSALDTESERIVQSALDNVMKNRTTIIIAHRLSTVQNADLIVVVDHGSIIESGTHASLIKKNGFYAQLVKQQNLNTQRG